MIPRRLVSSCEPHVIFISSMLILQTRGILGEIPVWKETYQAVERRPTVVACTKVGKILIS